MNHCKQPGCKFAPWRRRLCFRHWRYSQGFVFDPEQKAFIKDAPQPTQVRTFPAKSIPVPLTEAQIRDRRETLRQQATKFRNGDSTSPRVRPGTLARKQEQAHA